MGFRSNSGVSRWFWYVARPNEIFVDLDSGKAISRALSVVRRALLVKPTAKTPLNKLPIESVWLYPSGTEGHAHLILVLAKELTVIEKVSWSLWLGTDQIRAAYVIERFLAFWRSADVRSGRSDYEIQAEILATHEVYGFRKPDTFCYCKDKHKKKSVTDKCDALERILGDHRSDDYFPRNRDTKERESVRFPWGKVPLTNLRRWSVANGRKANVKTARRGSQRSAEKTLSGV